MIEDRKGWKLPCEKCGAVIEYDGVSLPGKTCPHCGASRPHTLKGNPMLPFLFFFGGWLVFGLINPLQWSDESLLFASSGSLLVLLWFKVFLPMHLLAWKTKRSKAKSEREFKITRGLGCVSFGLLFFGLFCLLIFCFESKMFSPDESFSPQYDYVFSLSGHEVTGGIDSVPRSPASGKPTKIGFINRAEFPVEIHWLDHNGTLGYVATLAKDHGQNAKAFVGQTWLVSDLEGTPLLYFVAEEETPDGAFGKGTFSRD